MVSCNSPQLYHGDDKSPYEEMVSCNSPRLYHGDDKLLLEEMVSVTVHSYIMEMTSDFKKKWWG